MFAGDLTPKLQNMGFSQDGPHLVSFSHNHELWYAVQYQVDFEILRLVDIKNVRWDLLAFPYIKKEMYRIISYLTLLVV